MSQPVRDVSNSSVKKRGRGVGVNSGVCEAVGGGVSVTGIGVCVAVGSRGGVAVGVDAFAAAWQAVIKMRHAMRSFFIAHIKT
jgi:hypothetical protein